MKPLTDQNKLKNFALRLGCRKIIDCVISIETKQLIKSERSRVKNCKRKGLDPFLLTQAQYEGTWFL